jgi:hypothetical protein
LFQQTVQSILSALGLGGQVAQPAIANVATNQFSGTGSGSGSSSTGILPSLGAAGTGAGNLLSAFA